MDVYIKYFRFVFLFVFFLMCMFMTQQGQFAKFIDTFFCPHKLDLLYKA